MKLKFALLVLALLLSPAAHAKKISIEMSMTSSAELIPLLFPEATVAAGAVCSAQVDRPMGKEDARSAKGNAIVCKNAGQTLKYKLGDSLVDQWGTRLEKYSFTVTGKFAEQMLPLFAAKTKGQMGNGVAEGSWAKILLCGPDGGSCATDYFLDVTPDGDSALQVNCGQDSDLIRVPTKIEADATTADSTDYYEYMTRKQIENGDRVVRKTYCNFLN